MSDKGDVYYCTWKKTEDGEFVGWEKRRPSLRAESESANELMSSLGEVIGEYYNDHEAAIHFDPPLRSDKDHDELFVDQLVSIGWNASFWFRPSANDAFEGGRCPSCGGGLGPRSSSPLIVDSFGAGSDGAFSYQSQELPSRNMPGSLTVVSDRFLSRLTDYERSTFEARPVTWLENRTHRFFEVIPKSLLPAVAIRGVDTAGWRCDRCPQRTFAHGIDLGWGVRVVSRVDQRATKSKFFFVGVPTHFKVCIPHARWRELQSKPGARKIVFEPLAVIEEGECDRDPWLPTLGEVREFRSKHGFKVPYKRPD